MPSYSFQQNLCVAQRNEFLCYEPAAKCPSDTNEKAYRHRLFHPTACWWLLLLFCLTAVRGNAQLAPALMEKGKQATALVEQIDTKATGSAFCIDARGYFLTNQHVVADSASGTLHLVLHSGEANQKVYAARVVRVDKSADLALLKVEGATFPMLPLGRVEGLIETTLVTAFGYPFGTELAEKAGDYPSITVSIGHVTALRKRNGVLQHIQLDASLNPGNSGGPVVNTQGEVVGVVQAGIPGSGIDLAIPVSHVVAFLDKPEIVFTPPATNLDTPHDLTIKLVAFHSLPDNLTVTLTLNPDTAGARMLTAERVDVGTYRVHAALAPPRISAKMLRVTAQGADGTLICRIKDQDVKVGAKTLPLSTIVQIDYQNGTRVVLNDGSELTGSLKGLEAVKADFGSGTQTLDFSRFSSLHIEEFNPNPHQITFRIEVKQAVTLLATAQGTLGNGRSLDGIAISPQPVNPAQPGQPVAPLPGKPTRTIPAPPRITLTPPVLPADRVEIALPSEVDKVAIGGAGRYLILHLPKQRKLAIFDAVAAKIIGYLSLASDDVLFAAGADKVAVLLRDQNILQRWSLKTLERELNVPFVELDAINNMVMGAGSEGPLLIVSNSTSKPFLFYDILTMNRVPGEFHVLGFGGDESNAFALWASVDGTVFTAAKPNTSPCEMFTMLFQGVRATGHEVWDQGGYALPGMDGAFICTSLGVLSGALKPLDPEHAGMMSCVPTFSNSYFLGVRNEGSPFQKNKAVVSLYAVTDRRLLITLPPFEELNAPDKWGRDKLSLEKRLVFLPASNLIVTLADSRNTLVLRRFDLMEALNKANVDYLFVSSSPERAAKRGQHYRYAIATKSRRGGVRYKLDSGPQGMTLTPTGLLAWNVPAEYANPMENIIVTIRDQTGQEVFHTFQITVE